MITCIFHGNQYSITKINVSREDTENMDAEKWVKRDIIPQRTKYKFNEFKMIHKKRKIVLYKYTKK